MKTMLKMISIFIMLIAAASCATTQVALPEKYNLDNDLEAVSEISKYRVTSWETVDNQSVILRANVSDYYLLVLHRPMAGVITSEKIGISSTTTTIRARFDKIYVKDTAGMQYYIIDKIYKLEGREQATQIKQQLRKN